MYPGRRKKEGRYVIWGMNGEDLDRMKDKAIMGKERYVCAGYGDGIRDGWLCALQ